MYGDYITVIEKHVMDFLLVLIELFPLGTTGALRANIGAKSEILLQRGRLTNISGKRGRPHQPQFFSEN